MLEPKVTVLECTCLLHNCRVQVGGHRHGRASAGRQGQGSRPVPGNVGNVMVTVMPGRTET